STFPERRLWRALRGGRLAGLKFRRQHAVGPYVVDFYCHEARLVVEMDGRSHNDRGREDKVREEFLKDEGLNVLRVSNDDVLDRMEGVLEGILKTAGRPLPGYEPRNPPPAAARPPSPRGEG